MNTVAPLHQSPSPPVVTMYSVLRSHSLGELKLKDTAYLQAAQIVVSARIAWLEHHVRTHNLFRDRVSEINTDLRWYRKVSEDIAALLTADFHAKS